MDVGAFSYDLNTAPPGYRCGKCDLRGVKLWRESHSSHVDLRCAACAGATDDLADSDQIGGHVPAVPDEDGKSWWGYTSVPQAGCEWWARLPCAVAVLPGRASMTAAEARAVDAKFAATMTTTDTRAALEAAIDAYATAAIANAGAALTDAWAAIAWAAISSAITAHVAAEVARALACAPGVEEAIDDVTVAWWDEAIRQCGRKEGFVIDEPDDRTTSGVALRAAIAADKARVVDDLLAKLLAGAGIDEQDRPFLPPGEQVDAILRWAQRAGDAYRGMRNVHEQLHDAHKRIEWQRARPTPDEARRLVDEFERLASIDEAYDQRDVARAALLRALGVES